jgi:hypothetical protein
MVESFFLTSACPVKFLPCLTNLLLMFNRGFEEDKLSLPRETGLFLFNWGEFNQGLPTSDL